MASHPTAPNNSNETAPQWNDLSSDLLLNILQYLNVRDAGRFAATCRWHGYLVHHYQRNLCGPQLVGVTIATVEENAQKILCQNAHDQLRTVPNLALVFGCWDDGWAAVEDFLPPETVILGAQSANIQSCLGGRPRSDIVGSMMCCSLPDATVRPFKGETAADILTQLEPVSTSESREDWKMIVVYAAEGSDPRPILVSLQDKFPHATIVGGVCEDGFVSKRIEPEMDFVEMEKDCKTFPDEKLRQLLREVSGGECEEASLSSRSALVNRIRTLHHPFQAVVTKETRTTTCIFGVALSGDVPVRSVVSRGMRSLTFRGPARPETPYYIEKSNIVPVRGGDSSVFNHIIESVKHTETGELLQMNDLIGRFGEPQMVGIRQPNADGFTLPDVNRLLSYQLEKIVVTLDNPSLNGCNIDLFELGSEEMLQDVDQRMQLLRQQTQGEQILGAVMFSCMARGPHSSGYIPEDMADATFFSENFPSVPLLGFYAQGEIGPPARAGRQSAFQSGKATLQSFTVVFALFIVPKRRRKFSPVDVSDETVKAYFQSRLLFQERGHSK